MEGFGPVNAESLEEKTFPVFTRTAQILAKVQIGNVRFMDGDVSGVTILFKSK